MASGTIIKNKWRVAVSPIVSITNDRDNGSRLVFRSDGKTLWINGGCTFDDNTQNIVITVSSLYKMLATQGVFLSYSGWAKDYQVFKSYAVSSTNNTITFTGASDGGRYAAVNIQVPLQ